MSFPSAKWVRDRLVRPYLKNREVYKCPTHTESLPIGVALGDKSPAT